MAQKKEALRELQNRLAQRMQAARSEQRNAAWLAVEAAGHGFLVPLAQAGEIFAVGELLPLPHTRPWFAGVANLRGGLHGVVDLAAFLGLRDAGPGEGPVRDAARLLALNAGLGALCALRIDRLAGLRNLDQMSLQPQPPGARPGFAKAVWRDAEGRPWQELDLAALAAHEQFLAIAA
jgi:twitching motility protein PilI